MNTASLIKNHEYGDNKPAISVLLETAYSKEIRIAMRAGQVMKEHKTPFPIVVELFEGKLDFGVQGNVLHLVKGDLIALEGNIPHDLKATEDSIVRLTLRKADSAKRVEKVIDNQ